MDKNLEVTTEDVFQTALLEGQRQILQELLELNSTDPVFLKAYIQARLKSLQTIKHFSAYKRQK